MTTLESEATCGVAEHDHDCLCDVVVGEPVQMMDDLSAMWGGRLTESELPLLQRLELLAQAHDVWVGERVASAELTAEELIERGESVRQQLRLGAPIVRVLQSEGMNAQDFVAMVFPCPSNAALAWTTATLIEIEGMVRSGEVSAYALGHQYGVSYHHARMLGKLFNPEYGEGDSRFKLTKDQRQQMDLWCLDPELTNQAVAKRMFDVYGIEISRAWVSKCRTKLYSKLGEEQPPPASRGGAGCHHKRGMGK